MALDIRGKLISLEGGEGTGKSSQIQILKQRLIADGYEVFTTRDPGGDTISSEIRKILLNPANMQITGNCEFLLYLAARAQINETIITPALNADKIVIIDRFIHSTMVYQCLTRGTCDIDVFVKLMGIVPNLNLFPDLTFLLDLDPKIGLRRSIKRMDDANIKEGRFENFPLEFHEAVRANYIRLAIEDPQKIKIIDAEQDKENISKEIYTKTKEFLECPN